MLKAGVLVIDLSGAAQYLCAVINADADFVVVDVVESLANLDAGIQRSSPSVLVLVDDITKHTGLQRLRDILRTHALPVLVVCVDNMSGACSPSLALDSGALAVLQQASPNHPKAQRQFRSELFSELRLAVAAASTLMQQRQSMDLPSLAATLSTAHSVLEKHSATEKIDQLILVGASTGGPDALKFLIEKLPADIPPVLVSLHIPAGFSETFAERVDKTSQVCVKQATDGEVLRSGCVYIAPGDFHMKLARQQLSYRLRIDQSEKVNNHRPSCEVLFYSVQSCFDVRRCSVVMLTGMGKDGSQAVATLKRSGAFTIAQDEASSVVWGMPGEVVKLHGASAVLPLRDIPARLMTQVKLLGGASAA